MALIGELPVGEKIKLTFDGSSRNFIIIHQGNPDSTIYDSSCDGTWLLMEDFYDVRAFDSGAENNYAETTIESAINKFTNLSKFDSDVQSAIKRAKIPYVSGLGNTGSLVTGANGLSSYFFLLSLREVGFSDEGFDDGVALSYFATATNTERIAYYNGKATRWWLRSPRETTDSSAYAIDTDGDYDSYYVSNKFGARFAFIISSDFEVADGSAIKGSVNIGGTYKELVGGHVNIGGTWKEICGSYVNIGGTWKQTF